jgi:tryptophanyl-tRNA synthetase
MIYAALDGRSVEQLVEDYTGRGYGDLKKDLAEVVADFVTPFRSRVLAYLDDPSALDAVLATGAAKAKRVAAQTLTQAYDRVGFLPAPA